MESKRDLPDDSHQPRIFAIRHGETDFNVIMQDIFDRKDFHSLEYTQGRINPDFIDPHLNTKGLE